MCLIIAENLNVHSFSLKAAIFGENAILEQNESFFENLLFLN
jgi:hypothetical protein